MRPLPLEIGVSRLKTETGAATGLRNCTTREGTGGLDHPGLSRVGHHLGTQEGRAHGESRARTARHSQSPMAPCRWRRRRFPVAASLYRPPILRPSRISLLAGGPTQLHSAAALRSLCGQRQLSTCIFFELGPPLHRAPRISCGWVHRWPAPVPGLQRPTLRLLPCFDVSLI